jgi:hypothetical protein
MLLITCLTLQLLLLGICGQNVDPHRRIDCYPDPNSSQQGCVNRGCIWDTSSEINTIPLCYFPPGTGYTSISGPAGTFILTKKADSVKNPFGTDVNNVIAKSTMLGKTLNLRFEVQGGSPRSDLNILPIKFATQIGFSYEVPLGIPKNPSTSSDSLQFNVANAGTSNLFQFTITRASTKTNLWDTSIGKLWNLIRVKILLFLGGLLFADKYIQIATLLPSTNVYGFGEVIHQNMKVSKI